MDDKTLDSLQEKFPLHFRDGSVLLINADCMEVMAVLDDGAFCLACCDPPYNVGASDGSFGGKKSKPSKISGKINAKHYANHNSTPSAGYFSDIFRVSKNQIIWGSNYYPQHLHHSGAIVWDKLTIGPLSDCEIAFQSFNKLVNKYTQSWTGFNKGGEKVNRVHPNQKPRQLYRWLYKNYAQPGQSIIDTHLGSGSSAIEAHYFGVDFVGVELDPDYFAASVERYKKETAQLSLF